MCVKFEEKDGNLDPSLGGINLDENGYFHIKLYTTFDVMSLKNKFEIK